MAEIVPFKGLLYNPEKVQDLQKVMAPPYDVISPEYQDELYERHPNNVIRLILGKTSKEDAPGSDRYSRAAEVLNDWTGKGVLTRDDKPAAYYYTQTYTGEDGSTSTRKGFIALARIEELGSGSIHPHEKTLSGPKADRLKLMEACEANFSCIFSIYSEPKLTINDIMERATGSSDPLIDVEDSDGVGHRLWRVDSPEVLEEVTRCMEGKPLFIADGHHRYETALNYRNKRREEAGDSYTGDEPWNFVMMYFSNMDDEGMTIWPTHRVIHSLDGFDPEKLLSECSEYFDVEEFPFTKDNHENVKREFLNGKKALGEKDKTAFGLQVRGKDVYYLLTLKDPAVMDDLLGESVPGVYKNLDVTVLHSLVLNRILGITQEDQEKQKNLVYVKNYPDAFTALEKDDNQLVFLLNPTRVEQVKAVAEAGHVMPQKSTYFYPKLLTGLVINLLGTEGAEPTAAKV